MKKSIIITIICSILAFTVGYFVGDGAAINRVNDNWDQIVAEKELHNLISEDEGKEVAEEVDTKYEEESQNEIPIYLDEITPIITILEPNSIGTVYMEATYKNNSKYPITSYSAKILLKDKQETAYLSNHDTVLPGETSPKFDCFGPDTGKEEDYEILTLDVRARLDNGKTLKIEYDFKLEEAEWSEYDR